MNGKLRSIKWLAFAQVPTRCYDFVPGFQRHFALLLPIFGVACRNNLRFEKNSLRIKYPAASSGVLEERQLTVFMELMIIISLLFDIVRDRILIAVFPYGTCKIPVRPEFSSPKLFFYLGTSLEYFPCCNAFDCRYDPCHTIRWNRLHEEMHMVLIRAYLQKLQLVALLNFYAHVFHCFINAWVKYRTSVFGRKYQMVYEYRNIMTFVDIFAHIDILRRNRRGIQPEVIKGLSGGSGVWSYR